MSPTERRGARPGSAPRRHARARLIGLVGLAGFTCFFALGCLLYPVDSSGRGYSFFKDYLCDLLDPVTPAGLGNPARPWMVASFCSLGVCLAAVFDQEARLSGRRSIQSLGWIAAVSAVAVGVSTALELLRLHGVVLLIGGPAALGALVVSLFEQKRRGELLPWGLGVGVLALGSWNLLQFARQFVLDAPRWEWLPAVQKAVLLFGVAWVAVSLLPASDERAAR